MAIQYWMQYLVVISDPAKYALALSMTNSSGLLEMTPRAAGAALGIPFPYPSGNVSALPAYITFFFPFTPGQQIGFPNPSGVFVDDTILTVTVTAQAGVPASIWPAQSPQKDGVFTWSGVIMQSAAAGATTNPPVPTLSNIPQRRHLAGREMNNNNTVLLEGGSVSSNSQVSRDASRTGDGLGWAIRGGGSTNTWARTPTQFRTIADQTQMWDRFYFRVRRLPSQATPLGIWSFLTLPSSTISSNLKITQAGLIQVVSRDGVGTETIRGTLITSVVLNQWYKIDVLVKCDPTNPGVGFAAYFVNGSLLFTSPLGGQANSIQQFTLGKYNSVNDPEFEIDYDDWINNDWPANFSVSTVGNQSSLVNNGNYSIDWLTGSHVRVHNSVGISQVNWNPAAASVGVLNQQPGTDVRVGTSEMTSNTSGSTLEGLTDALTLNALAGLESSIGVAGAIIAVQSKSSAGGEVTGRLGYRIAGAAAITTAINEGLGENNVSVAYLPVLGTFPVEVSPLSVTKLKSTNANTNTVYLLTLVVEYIGVWGPEDSPSFIFPNGNNRSNYHNGRYFGSVYSGIGSRPVAPVYAVGGTYVGNGTYTEIVLPAPCHFLKIRDTGGAGGPGINFFGSSNNPHSGTQCQTMPNCRLFYDIANNQYKIGITGAAGSYNTNGTTYQYIAFCDPGMRWNLTGAFSHATASSVPKVNNFVDASFAPDCGFAQQEDLISDSSNGLLFRGPGTTGANDATALDGSALVSTFGNFAAGIFNSLSRINSGGGGAPNTNYSMWRILDSGSDSTSIMVQIFQYTGNGSNPRTIVCTPTSNRFPLFVAVFPNTNAQSYYRDPSHAGNNSCQWNTSALQTNGITAVGMDSITVQSALNTNGVTYSVLIICGDTAGMNNGTFSPGYNPGSNANYQDPQFNNGVVVLGSGGLVLDGISSLGVLKNISGLYQLTSGLTHDTLQDVQVGQPTVNVKIPDPTFKTGYVGG